MTCGLGCWAGEAYAHQAPAEPPLFARADCIERVDKREQSELVIAYHVAADDTVLMNGDIDLPDAKTHQFLAFDATIVPNGYDFELYARELDGPEVRLPLWLSLADAERAADASGAADATGFSAMDVPEGSVLDDIVELQDRYVRITADDARVPITMAQAAMGVRWPLKDVPAGVYTVAGYIFSPPYNGWMIRDAPIKLIDAEHDPPALALQRVQGSLFADQGRHVRGCMDVSEGTTLSGDFAVDERPEAGWVQWLPERPAQSGMLDECFHNPRPELTGSVRLRFLLRAPAGETLVFYAPDTITTLPGNGACTEQGDLCCAFSAATSSAASDCADGSVACSEGVAGAVAPADARDAAAAAEAPAFAPVRKADGAAGGGCAVHGNAASGRAAGRDGAGWSMLGLPTIALAWRAAQRRHFVKVRSESSLR